MIKINLLPVRASKKNAAGRTWIVVLLVVFGVSVAGNYWWLHLTDARVDEVKDRIARDRIENKKLEGVIGQVKDLKKAKDEMKQKLGVLNKLKDGRQGPVRMMDELASIIPSMSGSPAGRRPAGPSTSAASAPHMRKWPAS